MKFLKVTSVNPSSGKEEGETVIRNDLIDRVFTFDGSAEFSAKAVLVLGTEHETIYVSQTVDQVFQWLKDI